MLVLSMDSSAKPASAAVCADGVLLGQYFQNSGLTHSRTLLAMAEDLLKNLELSVADMDLIAVSRGPGSFTGVRIGVSAANGLAWGADKPVCGVSTLEAMAFQTEHKELVICPVMDARRSQVYNALFKWQDGRPVRLCEDRAISLEDLSAVLKTFDTPTYLVGDGACLSYDFLAGAGVSCLLAPALMRYQTAYGVALAAAASKPTSALELEPSYLRPSQAEREKSL
ncbi:MAG: tRNA (adenosine(37)-N6)-threonylcarbamoyltransferase complex dimerization subunit type 1 TsaB [Oscillospiraceae bacterium]|nr:tRNA (adenosine(37)-N6)-threonylcarbamoyltransferase complex dimerization subunit type 1 TsaB [Oscillospiraceae bacterium]